MTDGRQWAADPVDSEAMMPPPPTPLSPPPLPEPPPPSPFTPAPSPPLGEPSPGMLPPPGAPPIEQSQLPSPNLHPGPAPRNVRAPNQNASSNVAAVLAISMAATILLPLLAFLGIYLFVFDNKIPLEVMIYVAAGVIFLIAAPFFLTKIAKDSKRASNRRQQIVCTGDVVAGRVASSSMLHTGKAPRISCRYEYVVDGQRYSAGRTWSASVFSKTNSKPVPGTPIWVIYDPQDPTSSVEWPSWV